MWLLRRLPAIALLLAAGLAEVALARAPAAEETPTATAEACTATSTNGFYDLRRDIAVAVEEGAKPKHGVPAVDYLAKGFDFPSNFTLNICAPVLKPPKEAVGVEKENLRNISAYYELDGKTYSLGQESGVIKPRGPRISLQYTGGSPCGDDAKLKDKRGSVHTGASYKYEDYDDEEEAKLAAMERAKSKDDRRRKSATFSFHCDHDMMGAPAAVTFVGSTPDECAYFFEVRSSHACAGVEPHKPGSVGPGGVFAIILGIAILVYVIGGIFYQRTVAHARGWRQLPNYSLWAGIWGFISDWFIILTSSCTRCIPGRRGYRTLSSSPNGRGRNRDDENRLIDQLDEEWDD